MGLGQPNRISGTVIDDCGDPLAHSVVTLVASGSRVPLATASTNDEGEYFFPPVEPGNYDVRFDYPGLKSAVGTVSAAKRGDVTVDLRLGSAVSMPECQ